MKKRVIAVPTLPKSVVLNSVSAINDRAARIEASKPSMPINLYLKGESDVKWSWRP